MVIKRASLKVVNNVQFLSKIRNVHFNWQENHHVIEKLLFVPIFHCGTLMAYGNGFLNTPQKKIYF